MNKPVIFQRIVAPIIWETLEKVYGIKMAAPSDKQEAFANALSDELYQKFGNRLDKTTLREIYGDEYGDHDP